jgi:hypothetical protein
VSARAGPAAGLWFLIAVVSRCAPQPQQTLSTSPARAEPAGAFDEAPALAAEKPGVRAAEPGGRSAASPTVRAALDRVRAARGLEPRWPIATHWVTRSELGLHVRTQLLADDAGRMAEALEALLFGLNVVSVDFDLASELVELTTQSLAGLYDPHSKELLVATDLDRAQTEGAVEHELVHALQDQHFGINDRLLPVPDGSDRASALQSLAEGDATCATSSAACAPITAPPPARPQGAQPVLEGTGAPPVLHRALMAPYADGVALVRWLLERGGWARVDAVWARPPETSEQVLHPEKLMAREPAECVPVPVAPDPRFGTAAYRDVMGEQALRVLLAEWLPESEAASRAAGWGGDRLAVYQQGQRVAVAWHIRYDTPAAAARGFWALRAAGSRGELENGAVPEQQRRAPRSSMAGAGFVCQERARRGPLALVRDGRDIAVTIGPFVRNAGQSRSDGNCGAALTWARAVSGRE